MKKPFSIFSLEDLTKPIFNIDDNCFFNQIHASYHIFIKKKSKWKLIFILFTSRFHIHVVLDCPSMKSLKCPERYRQHNSNFELMNNPMFRILSVELNKQDFADIQIDDTSDFRDLEGEETMTFHYFIDDKNLIQLVYPNYHNKV